MKTSTASLTPFRVTTVLVSALLVVQYVLGMLLNLYVQFPDNLPDGNAWQFAFTSTSLVPMHLVVGTLILICSIVALVLSIVARSGRGALAAAVGLAMIVLAYLSGVSFLSNGQQDTTSLLMALGFLGALLAYFVGYVVTRPESSTEPIKEARPNDGSGASR